MAKFFISYSRSVKDEVRKVIDLLKASGHEVWWDGDIPIMADWWATILDKIEWCDVFVFVTSEKSVQSAYCLAELKYAADRNRPILPFILEDMSKLTLPADLPPRGQWLVYDGDPAHMLEAINTAYANINWQQHHDIAAPRPPEPKTGGVSVARQFQEARRLADALDFEAAKRKLRDIKRLDYGEWGPECDEWLARLNSYPDIMTLVDDAYTHERAREAWAKHGRQYGKDYDPYDIEGKLKGRGRAATASTRRLPMGVLAGGAVVLLLAVLGIGFALLNNGGGGDDDKGPAATQVVENATDTPTTEAVPDTPTTAPSATDILEPTDLPSHTPAPSDTPTSTATDTATATLTLTNTPTTAPTATLTLTNTPTTAPASDPEAAAMQKAEQGVSSNGEWVPYIKEIDGVEMVLVPAGCFLMGSNNGEPNEQPVHEICFDEPFWIDRYEVTNAQFAAFGGQAANPSYWTDDNLPRESITWFEAHDYCGLREARLPTEAEWEYVARGPSAWEYPWGDEFEADNVVYEGNSDDHTWAVGSKPSGMSWVGALDMAGNVWEWVSTIYNQEQLPYPYSGEDGRESNSDTNNSRGLRGGFWGNVGYTMRSAFHNGENPSLMVNVIGFRCARSQPQELTEEQALQLAEQGVSSNGEWVPYIKEIDGVEMVLVPAGCFLMGSDNGNSDEQPVHEICFDEPFWIDRYEVTNAQFATFGGQAASASHWSDDDLPRESITWFEARDFCGLREARLPTEAEWEYAARGPSAWEYPWGEDFDEDNVVYEGNSDDHTWAVGSKPSGMSWVGALDMAGNVWEWVSTIYNQEQFPYPYSGEDGRESNSDTDNSRGLRGGSWYNFDYYMGSASRIRHYPSYVWNGDGFRCARSQPQDVTEEQALQLAEQGVSSNGEWVPYIKEFDGVEMVLVPAGCFMMGSTDEQLDYAVSLGASRSSIEDEQPVHEICFDEPFWIDRYEVTNA